MKYGKLIGLVLMVVVLTWSCRVPKELNPVKPVQPPTAFKADTLLSDTAVLVAWRDYFKDTRLVSLIDTAMSKNLDMQIANQRVFAAQANLSASKSALFPQLRAAGWAGATQYGKYTQEGVGNFDTNQSSNISSDQKIPDPVTNYYVGAGASWETGLWGKLRNRKRAQFNRFLASTQGRQLVITRLVAEVAARYYELLALDNELDIIRRFVRLQERAVDVIHIQKQSGRITELGVKQFEAQLYRFRAMEVVKRQEIIATENALNTLLGRFPQSIQRNDTLDLNNLSAMANAGVPSQLLINRPDIRQAESTFIGADYELKAARAAYFPTILITADAGMNAFRSSQWFLAPESFAYNVLGGISAPILNRYQITAAYRNAYANRNQAFIEYQRAVLTGVEEVSTELNRVANYRRVSLLKAQERQTLVDAVDISTDLFLTGYANYMEVLIARGNRLETELQLTETYKQQYLAAINLSRALGGGWR